MDMNRTFFTPKEAKPRWRFIDAQGQVVGRLATQIATMLRDKDTVTYTPHAKGDYVVVINADKVVFTGDKMSEKEYQWYTGWIGGLKTFTAEQFMKKDPTFILHHAVKGMLPKNKLSKQLLRRLKIYVAGEHPHMAQNEVEEVVKLAPLARAGVVSKARKKTASAGKSKKVVKKAKKSE